MRYESDYISVLKGRIEELKDEISRGYCNDFAAYCKAVGVVAGLRESLELLENLLKGNEDE